MDYLIVFKFDYKILNTYIYHTRNICIVYKMKQKFLHIGNISRYQN